MADVVVIGAGGGGPVVAYELASKGVSVTMLEAGPWLDPDRDFSRLEDDMGGLVFGRLKWGPGDRSKPAWVRRRDGVGLALQAAGVGGTTLQYRFSVGSVQNPLSLPALREFRCPTGI